MSETQEDAAPAAPAIPPDLTVTTRQTMWDGQTIQLLVATFGTPERTIELVELDLGARFDLAEYAGVVPGENLEWRNMAFIAASARSIDGVMLPTPKSKANLRNALVRLGNDGLRAAIAALDGYRGGGTPTTEDAHRSTVGNS